MKKLSALQKRVISGAVYVAIIVGLFCFRIFTAYAVVFDAFFVFLSALGTFEVARALRKEMLSIGFLFDSIFGLVFPIIYIVLEYFLHIRKAFFISCLIIVICLLILLVVKIVNKSTFKRWGVTILPILYPTLGIFSMMFLNDLAGEPGLMGLLFVFCIPAVSDTVAYFTGTIYNKVKRGTAKKFCPNISPNKTWAGVIGALVGGTLTGLIIYFIVKPTPHIIAPGFVFTFIAFVASIVNIFGDLFESYIKRQVGIKDMGIIMPGHGGVMDRIDGVTFTALYMVLMIVLIVLL